MIGDVAGRQVLLRAVDDRAHAGLGDHVLLQEVAGEAAEVAAAHRGAVLAVVVVAAAREPAEVERVVGPVADDRVA